MPGLANRIAGRWAKAHATGMPAEYYPYPTAQTRHVGVLVSSDFQPVTSDLQASYKQALDIPVSNPLLLITGGSLGSRRINDAMIKLVPRLLEQHQDLHIIHQVGKGNERVYGPFTHERLQVLEFMQGQHRYMGAADIVVTRAGANTLAEFGVQGKACIVIPNPLLTGGHQVKNGVFLQENNAALVVDESTIVKDAQPISAAINHLLDHPEKRQQYAKALQDITIPDAAHQLAVVLLEAIPK
jgi:UDP-N-acetylglucosamine--N-acetylmuramyl-(pentapeptide) pyrophosphoryl-undecaprenol N-acetylglucosamine transferase